MGCGCCNGYHVIYAVIRVSNRIKCAVIGLFWCFCLNVCYSFLEVHCFYHLILNLLHVNIGKTVAQTLICSHKTFIRLYKYINIPYFISFFLILLLSFFGFLYRKDKHARKNRSRGIQASGKSYDDKQTSKKFVQFVFHNFLISLN